MLQVSWISAQQAQGVGRLRPGSDSARAMLLQCGGRPVEGVQLQPQCGL